MALLEIDDLRAYYGAARALHGVSLSLERGEIAAVAGPNGAGKSTLMDAMMGLVACEGSIRLDGREILGVGTRELVRRGIGYAPERAHLFPYMSVLDTLLVGSHTSRRNREANLSLTFDLFPALASRKSQETYTQSGGERQMVSLGRALMTSPRLLLVDEPTIGLAPKICDQIAEALRRLNAETGLTILIAEQNVNFAFRLASRISILETGLIRMSGSPEALRSDPDLNRAYFGH